MAPDNEEPTLQPGFSSNPLPGLANFVGDTLGLVTGGLIPDSEGQNRGPLADIVQGLFGDDPFAAESWASCLNPTRQRKAWEPNPSTPGPLGSPPPSHGLAPTTPGISIQGPDGMWGAKAGVLAAPAPGAVAASSVPAAAPGAVIQNPDATPQQQDAATAQANPDAPQPEDLEPHQTDGSPEANAAETARLEAAKARAAKAALRTPAPTDAPDSIVHSMIERFNTPVWGPNNPPPTAQDREISQPTTPGTIRAVTTDAVRTYDANGYGNALRGAITLNGNTYNFVTGGRRGSRGSAPFGEYEVGQLMTGEERGKQGYSYKHDAFPLSDKKDDAPGTQGQDLRRGLLIHDASGSGNVTAGCIGIVGGPGAFERFKRDMAAEIAKNGGKLKLNLGPKPGDDKSLLSANPGDPPRPAVGMIRTNGNQIDPVSFAKTMENKVANSPLNGQAPEWARQFGVDGSPRSWSRFFTMVQQQESGHKLAPTNPDGSLQRFGSTPKGENSYGPGQFNVGQYGLKTWADVNNPDKVADAYINVAKAGKFTQYFGSVQRPHETLQHTAWFNSKVAPHL